MNFLKIFSNEGLRNSALNSLMKVMQSDNAHTIMLEIDKEENKFREPVMLKGEEQAVIINPETHVVISKEDLKKYKLAMQKFLEL